MAVYDYDPTTFNGVDLTASPFNRVWFMVPNSPVTNARSVRPIEADVIGVGPQDVRAQPRASVWDLHVELTGDTVALEKSFKEVFSEERELVFLIANDGDGTAWRVECRVIGTRRVVGSTQYWIVSLRVPNPLWETNALVTDTDSNNAGDSTSDTITNAGNRKAFPKYKISVDAQKARDPEQDFMHAIRGYVVNRSPTVWSDLPVDLTDSNDGHGGWDTLSLITNTAESGTASGTVGATATSMTLAGGHGFSDGPQFFFVVNSNEQFYGVLATNAISGMVRGIGGTTAASIDNLDTIRRSDMLANMNDVRIWLNGRQIERWTDAETTAASRIWVNMTMPPAVKLTPSASGSASIPAGGGSIRFDEGVEGLPESGVLWNGGDSTPNRELISYSGRDIPGKKVTGIQRDIWTGDGPPGTAWAAGDVFYLVSALYVIQYGRTEGLGSTGSFSNPLDPPPNPLDRRPAIQLPASSNIVWRYGDQADDALTIFHDPDNPNRTAQFRPDYSDPDDLLSNDARLLQLADSSDICQWKDGDPVTGNLNVGRLTIRLPQGVEAVADGITYDVTRRPGAWLRIVGRGEDSFENKLAEEITNDEAEATATAQKITPANTLRELTLEAIRSVTTGQPSFDDTDAEYFRLSENLATAKIPFTLDETTRIEAIAVRLWADGAAGFDADALLSVKLHEDSSGAPGTELFPFATASFGDGDVNDKFDPDDLSQTKHMIEFFFKENTANARTPFALAAGIYWVVIILEGTGDVGEEIGLGGGVAQNIGPYHITTTVDDTLLDDALNTSWIAIVHNGEGPIESIAERFNPDTTPSFDKLILQLNDNADPALDETPWVDRISDTAETDVYHVIGNWKNDTTGDEIDIDAWIDTGMTFTINTENKRVELSDPTAWIWSLPVVIKPSNLKEWLPVQPGANTLTYTEQDMVNTDLVITHRGKKV